MVGDGEGGRIVVKEGDFDGYITTVAYRLIDGKFG